METVLFFGPMREWFYQSIALGNGINRKACYMYMLFLPMFIQLKKKNYFDDTLVHVVNIIARWPFMIRMIVRRNCSVNLSGGNGHNLAFDEFMETFVVRPLKSYVSGKTALKVLNAISGSLQMSLCVRRVHHSKAGLDIHPTKRHSVAYALPDQLKVALFCFNNGFFKCDNSSKMIKCIKIEAVTSRSTHKIDEKDTDGQNSKIRQFRSQNKIKISQIQVLGKSTGQSNIIR